MPVSREQQEQVASLPMPLPDFEDGLFAGDIVSTVPIDEDEPFESVQNEVLRETTKQIDVRAGRAGERSWKIKMMVRVSQPHQWGIEHAVREPMRRALHDFSEQNAIREERQVMPMLLERGDG